MPTGLTMDPLVEVNQPADYQTLLREYRLPRAKSDVDYTISKCNPRLRPRLNGMILGRSFKRRITYMNNETFEVLAIAETLATSGDKS